MLNIFAVQIYFRRLTKAILFAASIQRWQCWNHGSVGTNANIIDSMFSILPLDVTTDCTPWSQPLLYMLCGHSVSRHSPSPSTWRQPNKFPYLVSLSNMDPTPLHICIFTNLHRFRKGTLHPDTELLTLIRYINGTDYTMNFVIASVCCIYRRSLLKATPTWWHRNIFPRDSENANWRRFDCVSSNGNS